MTNKILVIDDDELIRLTIKNVLKRINLTVLEAKNGNEGLSVFKSEQPHMVITDILMPDKEGLETIKEMREFNPNVKILAISGGGNMQNMTFLQLAEKLGANLTLTKPLKPDDLLKAVQTLLTA
jgi:CheY-like chemotaxis protein